MSRGCLGSLPACLILQVDWLPVYDQPQYWDKWKQQRDIKELCEYANLQRSLHSPKWVAHCCETKGYREGFAIVDWNEKINRPVCAAPKSQVSIPQEHIFMTSMCTCSPITGWKHQKPSKFCSKHTCSYLDSGDDSDEVDPSYPLPTTPHKIDTLLQTGQIGDLPENDDPSLLTGCRKERM